MVGIDGFEVFFFIIIRLGFGIVVRFVVESGVRRFGDRRRGWFFSSVV